MSTLFQVRFNWERTRDYFILNGALVSVALGLQRSGDPANNLLVGCVLLIACVIGILGTITHRTGHKNYRRTVYKKTLLEDILGLARTREGYAFEGATLAITSTAGHAETTEILHHTENWLKRGLRRGSIVFWVFCVLVTFSILEFAAALYFLRAAQLHAQFWIL
jgi:Ca2+/Na+ antiporter